MTIEIEDSKLQHAFDDVDATDNESDPVINQDEPLKEPEPTKLLTDDPYAELRSEFAQLLEQNNQKVFGKIGELNRTLLELKAGAKTSAPKQISIDQLKNFRQEFGDDAAEMLAKDLNEVISTGDTVDVSSIIDQFKQDNSKFLVASQHRDWQSVTNSEEFNVFRNGLSDENKQLLATTWEPDVVIDAISAFKAFNQLKSLENFELWKGKLKDEAVQRMLGQTLDPDFYASAKEALLAWNKVSKQQTEQKQISKQKRLEAAMSPKGSSDVEEGKSLDDWFNDS